MNKRVAIFGTGGLGRAVLENLSPFGVPCVFLDDNLKMGNIVNDCLVVGGKEMLTDRDFLDTYEIIIALGDNKQRGEFSRLVKSSGGRLARSIHPTAIIQRQSTIGDGTVVMPHALIGPNVSIGSYCIINNFAIVAHDSIVNNGVNISDRCSFTAEIGEEAFLGLHVVVLPRTPIGARAIVGAGSVVTKEVMPDTTVAGVPARFLANVGTHHE